MAKNMINTVGQSDVDNLFADNLIYQNRVEVRIIDTNIPQEGLKRGQLLVFDTTNATAGNPGGGDGSTVLLPAVDTEVVDAVLLEDVKLESLGNDAGVVHGLIAAASTTGEVNRNMVGWGAIPEQRQDFVCGQTRANRQLDIKPMNQRPFKDFAGLDEVVEPVQ